ncbi:hypothetical protein EPO05_05175 [Patescibacteria group bacterium]|nr:MAG: hypothetical protein EPO05_05175 [Patescibacteria group bacterium]
MKNPIARFYAHITDGLERNPQVVLGVAILTSLISYVSWWAVVPGGFLALFWIHQFYQVFAGRGKRRVNEEKKMAQL